MIGELVTVEDLRTLFKYDEHTGEFTRRIDSGRFRAGTTAGTQRSNGYQQISVGYKTYPAHRLAWLYVRGDWPEKLIDHVNGVRNDNRFCNLREASVSENAQNSRAHSRNKLGLKGVSASRSGKRWCSYIRVEGRNINLGTFDSANEAHAAYSHAARVNFKNFANTGRTA